MKFAFVIVAAAVSTILSFCRRGGLRSVVAEMVLLRAQLIILKRKSPKVSKLTPLQRFILGSAVHFIPKGRIGKISILLSPATILKFHKFLDLVHKLGAVAGSSESHDVVKACQSAAAQLELRKPPSWLGLG